MNQSCVQVELRVSGGRLYSGDRERRYGYFLRLIVHSPKLNFTCLSVSKLAF